MADESPRRGERSARRLPLGPSIRCFIIAEAGVNHNGELSTALQLVDAAAGAGADAVKFQTFVADRVASVTAPKATYQRHTTDATESQLAMLRRLQLPPEAYRKLQAHCHERGILFLSTPFDRESVDLLNRLGVRLFKIGSGEVTNLPFLDYVARKGKPIILSTGMSTLGEVDAAVLAIEEAGCSDLTLLHCVSNYPAIPPDVNLRAMQTMGAAWGYPVGYSDHTPGIEVALAAVALGACVLEKHLTLNRSLPGPDHLASLEPDQLEEMVRSIRNIEHALGSGRKIPAPSEVETAACVRRSIAASADIPAGRTIEAKDLVILRPGTGLPPSMLQYVVGRTARRGIPRGTVIELRMLS